MQDRPLGFCAVKRPDSPRPDEYEPLRKFRTCDISDAMNKSHTMSGIRAAYTPMHRVVGPAITVSVPGSGFQMIAAAMAHAQPGDILVISTHGATDAAYWGGYMSELAVQIGLAGVVVDGPLRDPDEIRESGFAAFARGFATRVAVNAGSWGEINMPVAAGGISVSAGDIVVADEDGVVAIPQAWTERAIHDTESLLSSEVAFEPPSEIEQRLRGDGLFIIDSPAG
jgi:4-hydroxy-4-methyl-2-oxoglutarate aldolase